MPIQLNAFPPFQYSLDPMLKIDVFDVQKREDQID